MNVEGVRYTMGAAAVGLLVAVAGTMLVRGEAVPGVWVGAGAAVVVQAFIYWTLFVRAFPDRKVVAHAVGVAIRFVAVAVVALWGVTGLGLAAAPTLFSMVACLFGSTLLEAYFVQRNPAGRAVVS